MHEGRVLGPTCYYTVYSAALTHKPVPIERCWKTDALFHDICLPAMAKNDGDDGDGHNDDDDDDDSNKYHQQWESKKKKIFFTSFVAPSIIFSGITSDSLSAVRWRPFKFSVLLYICVYIYSYKHIYHISGFISLFLSSFIVPKSLWAEKSSKIICEKQRFASWLIVVKWF